MRQPEGLVHDALRPPPGAVYVVELFGPITVRPAAAGGVPSAAITRFRSQRTASLLAYLAYFNGRRHMREVLADRLWPDSPTAAARHSLNVALSSLRSVLETPQTGAGTILLADRSAVAFAPGVVVTDAGLFERLLDRADALAPDRSDGGDLGRASGRAELLAAAVDTYDGVLLPGHYDDWIVTEQERLTARLMDALRWLERHHRRSGMDGLADFFGRRAESVSRGAGGGAGEGLESTVRTRGTRSKRGGTVPVPGDSVTRASRAETGPPGPVLTTPALPTPPAAPLPVPLPISSFHGRESEVDALVAWANGSASSHYGDGPLVTAGARLVTIMGPGGVGKTRLVREFVRRIVFGNGGSIGGAASSSRALDAPATFFASDLVGVTSPGLIGETVAAAIGCPVATTVASPSGLPVDPIHRIAAHIASIASPILLLDGVEHLLPDAAAWLEQLLGILPRLRVLVASRSRLMAEGEHLLTLEPLPVPRTEPTTAASDPDRMVRDWASLDLFVARARASAPDFRLTARNIGDVVALIARLDGLPLAIELASARCQVFAPAEILRRLDERRRFEIIRRRPRGTHDRHASLRDTLAWSADQLPEEVRRTLARLSVLGGKWTAAAAREIVAPAQTGPGAEDRTEDHLAHLVDTSFLCRHSDRSGGAVGTSDASFFGDPDDGAPCFGLLDSVREFAGELLADYGDEESAEVARRHAAYYARVAGRYTPLLVGSDGKRALAALRFHEENLNAAITSCLRTGVGGGVGDGAHARGIPADDAALALELCWTLRQYWLTVGIATGRAYLTATIGIARRSQGVPTRSLSRALAALGLLALTQGDSSEAELRYRQALRLTRRYDPTDLRRIAQIQNNLGTIAIERRRWVAAGDWLRAALRFWRDAGDVNNEAAVVCNLGTIAGRRGDLDAAESLTRDAIRLAEKARDDTRSGVLHINLGQILHKRADLAGADAAYRSGLRRLLDRGGQTQPIATGLLLLGLSAAARADQRAEWMLAAAEAAHDRESLSPNDFARQEYRRLGMTFGGMARASLPLDLDTAAARACVSASTGETDASVGTGVRLDEAPAEDPAGAPARKKTSRSLREAVFVSNP